MNSLAGLFWILTKLLDLHSLQLKTTEERFGYRYPIIVVVFISSSCLCILASDDISSDVNSNNKFTLVENPDNLVAKFP